MVNFRDFQIWGFCLNKKHFFCVSGIIRVAIRVFKLLLDIQILLKVFQLFQVTRYAAARTITLLNCGIWTQANVYKRSKKIDQFFVFKFCEKKEIFLKLSIL